MNGRRTKPSVGENEDSDTETVADKEAADACEETGGADVATRRRRLRITWRDNPTINPEVRHAESSMQYLALRVGAVPVPSSDDNGGHHLTFFSLGKQQGWEIQCLFWSGWCQQRRASVNQCNSTAASDAVRVGWSAWSSVMRLWGIMHVDDLTEWLRNHGLPATRPRQHLSARAQEFILQEECRTDARVALLETVLVLTTLHQGRVIGVTQAARTIPAALPRRSRVCPIPAVLPTGSWEQLDEVDLSEWFGTRVSMLKICPFFFRGRLRQCFSVALRERHRTRQAEDTLAEKRAWKLFGLIPMMMLHRPRGAGAVGRDELAQRADDFARGKWTEMLQDASQMIVKPHLETSSNEMEEAVRKGRAALNRVQRGQVSRARQELTGAALAPKNMDTLAELQGRRPQERVVDIPQEMVTFVPDRSVELDMKLFTKCVQSAPSGCSPGPGGCTNEMLRLCLDDMELFQMLFRAAEDFARAQVPDAVMNAFMSATMTALQKPEGGGVRGKATGTSFRRLVVKC